MQVPIYTGLDRCPARGWSSWPWQCGWGPGSTSEMLPRAKRLPKSRSVPSPRPEAWARHQILQSKSFTFHSTQPNWTQDISHFWPLFLIFNLDFSLSPRNRINLCAVFYNLRLLFLFLLQLKKIIELRLLWLVFCALTVVCLWNTTPKCVNK